MAIETPAQRVARLERRLKRIERVEVAINDALVEAHFDDAPSSSIDLRRTLTEAARHASLIRCTLLGDKARVT